MSDDAPLKLWIISRDGIVVYETFDSAIVASFTEEDAKAIHPGGSKAKWDEPYSSWPIPPEKVKVKLIGVAEGCVDGEVVLASFNAG